MVKIARSGKEIGTYDSAEVIRLLGVGTLQSTDHYWHTGMVDWRVLADSCRDCFPVGIGVLQFSLKSSSIKLRVFQHKAQRYSV